MSNQSFVMALRLADSFLPVGTYTSSYGIEQYVNESRITTAAELGKLVDAYLRQFIGPTDTVALANAYRALEHRNIERLQQIDTHLHTATLPAEFRESGQKAGNQLLELMLETHEELFEATDTGGTALSYTELVAAGKTPGQYPVAIGVITQLSGCTPVEAALLHAYSFVTELLGAAQRLGAFGHTAIQSQLTSLLSTIVSVSTEYIETPLSSLSSFAPMAEIQGMSHERANRRLFMS